MSHMMGKNKPIKQLERYEELLSLLKSGEPYTTSSLALQLGVTRRTIDRDIGALRSKGYPIEADRGRGGGVRLYPNWGIGKITLNNREVLDLLISITVLEKLKSPLFLDSLSSIRNKIHLTFPDSQRHKVNLLRKRLLIADQASSSMLSSYIETPASELTDIVLEGFIEQKLLAIDYIDESKRKTQRTIEVHYLFLSWPIWYLVCYDHLRQASRTFRIDRILNAELLNTKFKTKGVSAFSLEIEQISTSL